MKFFHTMMAVGVTLWVTGMVGLAMADDGVGVCVAGQGLSANNLGAGTGYTGVNVAAPAADPTGHFGFTGGSTTGVYNTQAGYEAQCCAETGKAPDCFKPVQ